MNINWDEVAEEADGTPRALLADALAQVDDVEDVIIITKNKEGQMRRWISTAGVIHTVAMLEMAKSWTLGEAFRN